MVTRGRAREKGRKKVLKTGTYTRKGAKAIMILEVIEDFVRYRNPGEPPKFTLRAEVEKFLTGYTWRHGLQANRAARAWGSP